MLKYIFALFLLCSIAAQGITIQVNGREQMFTVPINIDAQSASNRNFQILLNSPFTSNTVTPFNGKRLKLDSTYCLRFEVANTDNKAGEWVLDLGSLSYASVCLVNREGVVEAKYAGRMLPYIKKSDPEIGSEIIRFSLAGKESKTVYLFIKIVNPTMKLNEICIFSNHSYEKQIHNNYLKYGLFFGFLGLLVICSILLSLFLKLRIYAIFALYVLFAGSFVGYLYNLTPIYVFSNWPTQSMLFEILFLCCFIAVSFMIQFFLEIYQASKIFFTAQRVWLIILILCIVALIIIAFVCSASTFFLAQDILSTLNLLITVLLLLSVFKIKNRALMFFIIGMMITVIGGIILQFSKFFMDINIDVVISCSTIEVFLVALSFAVAYRDADKKRQEKITELVNILQNQEIELKETNNHLEQRVQERTLSLEKQYIELQNLNALKNRFFSIIGHDLKNPIGTVIGFADLLIQNIDHYEINKTKQFIKHIHQSTSHTYQLLINLLEWAHSQTNVIKYQPTEVVLSELLYNTINIVQSTADSKGIFIRVKCHPSQTAMIDANMMQTILRNLLSNAIKFSLPGSFIDVSASVASKVVITVADHGVGMTPEQIGQLFHINTNRSTPGTNQETGTGLGLIICHEFTQRMKGEISVESTLGVGTSFSIIIPIDVV